jgi:hypothetical protein
MKDQIDQFVRGIMDDLAQPSPSVPEVAVFFQTIGADCPSKAVAKRLKVVSLPISCWLAPPHPPR